MQPADENQGQKRCRACRKNIEADAQVCHLCQRDQSQAVSFFTRFSGAMAATGLLATLMGTYVSCTSAIDAKQERQFAQTAAVETERLRDEVVELGAELFKSVHRSSTNDARAAWSSYFSFCEPADGNVDHEQCALKTELLLIVLKETVDDIEIIASQGSPVDNLLISDSYKRICRYSGNVDLSIYRDGLVPPMPVGFESKVDSLVSILKSSCERASIIYGF